MFVDEYLRNTQEYDELVQDIERREAEETKKAADNGGVVTFDGGYRTESGKPLEEADEQEFVLTKDGKRAFGTISKSVSKATMGELPDGEIRLRVGNGREGVIHAKEHESEILSDGYNSVEDMIYDVAQHYDEIYRRDNGEGKQPTYNLVKYGNKSTGKMNGVTPIYFELEKGADGNFYVVITAIPKGDRSLRRQLKKNTSFIADRA